MERYAGRVAVVTGASSGIGARIAQDLVREGLVVVGVARRMHLVQELAVSLVASGARGQLHAVEADLADGAEVRRVFKWVEDKLGGVSVLVNNAAFLSTQPMQDMEAADMQRLFATNLTAVALCCREALASMRRHGLKNGHVVNINSVTGHTVIRDVHGVPSVSAYAASKNGLTALSKGLRFDLLKMPEYKIRVTNVSPGLVCTEMVAAMEASRTGPVLQVQDISEIVLYALRTPDNVEIGEITVRPVGEPF
ncbi:farnesol dehydrogenase-like [Thrips palmi]|uniref:Farnesol dehydrogenase-like n=1 Tax=Thrips palmi TaxID=161013 RepID=A0A6P8ZL56_THRPL|nr:farnesol dehydrogenase-like [Thrips palmi]